MTNQYTKFNVVVPGHAVYRKSPLGHFCNIFCRDHRAEYRTLEDFYAALAISMYGFIQGFLATSDGCLSFHVEARDCSVHLVPNQ